MHSKAQFEIFFTISSQRRELSPTHTLKWPRHNRVNITCNTTSAYHVQLIVCHLVRSDSSAIKSDRVEISFILALLYWLLLQRSTAVQVRSSVRLMPQNQPSGRGLLPSPTDWSSDLHPVAMLADVSRHTLGRTEGRGLGFGQLVRTHTGKCLKC